MTRLAAYLRAARAAREGAGDRDHAAGDTLSMRSLVLLSLMSAVGVNEFVGIGTLFRIQILPTHVIAQAGRH